jgi:dTDP-4-dehydro-6-deoxy-alpha-D-glucopyranose 2,3-dehydratase
MNEINTIKDWIDERIYDAQLKVSPLEFGKTDSWFMNEGIIHHQTNGFFSIIGIEARSVSKGETISIQPIINQPEIGILGFVLTVAVDVLKILLQAKTEPGNVNGTQIAPTVQATYSNYIQLHNGISTRYLSCFRDNGVFKVKGTLQSEQGTRFLGKYNWNAIAFVNSKVVNEEAHSNWKWVPLVQLFQQIEEDYLINTDARSVLISSDWNRLVQKDEKPFRNQMSSNDFAKKLYISLNTGESQSLNTTKTLLENLAINRKKRQFEVVHHPLKNLKEWEITKNGISSKESFAVKYFNVTVNGREVPEWSQPLIHSHKPNLVILYCQEINGVLHFLLNYSLEIGFKEIVQFGPTINILEENLVSVPFNFKVKETKKIAEFTQSDEGGRFYHSITKYTLIEVHPNTNFKIDNSKYVWASLNQIFELLPQKGMFTNEFRSVLSVILKFIS